MSKLQTLAHFITIHGSTSLVLGTCVAALACVLAKAVGRDHAGTRFMVWFSALLAIAAVFIAAPFGWTHGNTAPLIALPSRAATYLAAVWLIGSAIGLARVVAGLRRVHALRASVVEIAPGSFGLIQQPRSLLSRRAAVGMSDLVRVPTAVGFFKPAVILPTWTINELSGDELNAVVLHELAHIDRWDDWTNLAQKVLRALLFFHPAVWWIDSRLSIEREMSCDDAVLALSGNPRKYAECLVSLAEKSYMRRPLAMAQAALGRVKDTATRIARILDGKDRRRALGWKPAAVSVTSFLLLAAIGIKHTPELVGFKEGNGNLQTATVNQTLTSARVTIASLNTPVLARPKPTRVSRRPKPLLRPSQPTQLASRMSGPAAKATLVDASDKSPTPQFMYVILQTHEFDGSGAISVTTTVLRIRVIGPNPKQASAELNPRST